MRQEALNMVYQLAKIDPRVIFIGSDLGAGTLKAMQEELPKQFFMEGISEQHIIGFAAGLAQEGFIPYVNTIGTFLTRRAYEQVLLDIGLHNLPVRLLASGGGMVYAPLGPTHTAVEDFSLMLNIPNMKVLAPADSFEMENLLKTLVDDQNPHYIRFGKGGEPIITKSFISFDLKPKIFGDRLSDVVILTTGIMLHNCLEAKAILSGKSISATIIHFPYLNQIFIDKIQSYLSLSRIIMCVEEHIPRGGLFSQLLHAFHELQINTNNLYQLSLPNYFSHNYGSQMDHFKFNGLSSVQIASRIQTLLNYEQ
jgi:transketolase